MSTLPNLSTRCKNNKKWLIIQFLLIHLAKLLCEERTLDISEASLSSVSFQATNIQIENTEVREYALIAIAISLGIGTQNNTLRMDLTPRPPRMPYGTMDFPERAVKVLFYEATNFEASQNIMKELDHRKNGGIKPEVNYMLGYLYKSAQRGEFRKTVEVFPKINSAIAWSEKSEQEGFMEIRLELSFEAKSKEIKFWAKLNLNMDGERKGNGSSLEFIQFPSYGGLFLEKELGFHRLEDAKHFFQLLNISMLPSDEMPASPPTTEIRAAGP